jgi:organic radical activating enzyme
MSSNRHFPIHSSTACKSKWNWSTLYLATGTTSSCHRVEKNHIPIDNFNSFHNLPNKLNDRELMLKGQWPTGGCSYCKNIEEVGGVSDRQYHLHIPNAIPDELLIDSTSLVVTPKIVEVYLNNICNLSCVYCHETFSSKIETENNKFGKIQIVEENLKFNGNLLNRTERKTYFVYFCKWLEQNIHSLERLQILGGEPFYQKEFKDVLKIIKANGHRNLTLNIVSNLMVSDLYEQIAEIKEIILSKKLKKLSIIASIDGWGNEQEYARYGLQMQTFLNNFEFLVQEKWIELGINQTITALTLKSIKDLYNYINLKKNNRKININFSLVMGHEYLNPKIFGKNFWVNDMKEILQLMPESNETEKITKNYMEGIFSYISSSEQNIEQIQNLKLYLDEIDRRRNLDWRKTFPYLDVKI